MTLLVVLGSISLVGSYLITELVRRWALANMLDIPNERSSHKMPTPRGGGVSIVSMTLLLMIVGLLLTGFFDVGWLAYIGVAVLIALAGWFDDRYTLSAKIRLLLQLILAGVFVIQMGALAGIELPLVGAIMLAPVIAVPGCVIWIVAFTNIYNFMDGIDGLAAVQAIIAGAGWGILLLSNGQFALALLAIVLALSSLGFLGLNRPPAKIFMGDVGSTFLGFTLSMLVLLAATGVGDLRIPVAGVLMVAPFVLDGTLTIVRRVLRHENILKPHRSHIYQRLTILGYTHGQVTSLYGAFALISAACGLLYANSEVPVSKMVALLIPVTCFILIVVWTTRQEYRSKDTVLNPSKSASESLP